MASQYPDSAEQAAEFVRLALPFMTQHGIPPSPPHYRVWYDYVSGRNAKLKESVDRALHVRDAIDQGFSEELFERFVEQESDAVAEQMRDSVHRLLSGTQESLLESGQRASLYDQTLQEYSRRLGVNPGRENLRRTLNELLAETKTMLEANQRLEQNLQSTNTALDTLRRELDRTRSDANLDALTAVATRKHFDARLEECLVEAQDSGRDLSLVLADLDHFNQFNAKHGHLLGDKVLRFVANHLQDATKGSDFVARYGGEEFAILLPCTPLSGALTLAQQIRAGLETQRLRRTDTEESVGKVTLSLGVAGYRAGEPAQALLARAEDTLQRAKREGRNRACCEIQRG